MDKQPSIVILNQLAARGEFDVKNLEGKRLLDAEEASFSDAFYVEGTHISVKLVGIGGATVYSDAYVSKQLLNNLLFTAINPVLPPVAELPSRLVLRKGDETVLGVLFGHEAKRDRYLLVPVSDISVARHGGPLGNYFRSRSFIELDKEYPGRPVFRYQPPFKDEEKGYSTFVFNAPTPYIGN